MKRLDLSGRKFGRWTVIERDETKTDAKGTKCIWRCLCECGKESFILTGTLTSGHSKGCWNCYTSNNKREKHYNWKGGRRIDSSNGYVVLNNNGKPRREHILIAEKVLGRGLKKGECVHHINGNKADNRYSNLLICDSSYHRWLECKMADLYKKEHF